MYRDLHAIRVFVGVGLLGALLGAGVSAQQAPPKSQTPAGNGAARPPAEPPDYVIGPDDILTIIVYGQDPMHSGDVVVRPDGKISRLMIGEVQAANLTTAQLTAELTKAYSKLFQEPVILVSPKEIKSRKVYITGEVKNPGSGEYLLNQPMDVLQLITKAGGLQDWANKENIRIIRTLSTGKQEVIVFNYNNLFEAKGTVDIPQLKPGDRVIVK
jgi:polysaccharide export outer membrane protein